MSVFDGVLNKTGHASHCIRCLDGLPGDSAQVDSSRVAIAFYCIAALDTTGLLSERVSETVREDWKEWVWSLQISSSSGSGFRGSPYMMGIIGDSNEAQNDVEYDLPHLVMTYVALLTLAILRDDFTKLNRQGLIKLLKHSQKVDGSFTSMPGQGESDVRLIYTAFAISHMLNDWSGVDIGKAVAFIKSCRTYEGGYGQSPFNEAQGGPTYCAIASLYLVPKENPLSSLSQLNTTDRQRTIHWLLRNQVSTGGFKGRTEKNADACYSFWCGATLHILNAGSYVNCRSNADFLNRCQFRYGGIAKSPDDHPDPYHTYLSLASLALFPPDNAHESWSLINLDPLLNASQETVAWIRKYIAIKSVQQQTV